MVAGEQYVQAGQQFFDAFAVLEQLRAGVAQRYFGDAAPFLCAAPAHDLAGLLPAGGVFRRGLAHVFQFCPGSEDVVQDRVVGEAGGKGLCCVPDLCGAGFLAEDGRQFGCVGEFDALDEALWFVARACQGNRAGCLRFCHDGVVGFFVL